MRHIIYLVGIFSEIFPLGVFSNESLVPNEHCNPDTQILLENHYIAM